MSFPVRLALSFPARLATSFPARLATSFQLCLQRVSQLGLQQVSQLHCKRVILKNNFDSQIALLIVHLCSFIEICMNKALGGSMWLIILLIIPCTFQLAQNFLFWHLRFASKSTIYSNFYFFTSPLKQKWIIPFLFLLWNKDISNSCRTWISIKHEYPLII
jgi:hypothetical protein